MTGIGLGFVVWSSSVLISKSNLDKTQSLPLPILLEQGGVVCEPDNILGTSEPAKPGLMH